MDLEKFLDDEDESEENLWKSWGVTNDTLKDFLKWTNGVDKMKEDVPYTCNPTMLEREGQMYLGFNSHHLSDEVFSEERQQLFVLNLETQEMADTIKGSYLMHYESESDLIWYVVPQVEDDSTQGYLKSKKVGEPVEEEPDKKSEDNNDDDNDQDEDNAAINKRKGFRIHDFFYFLNEGGNKILRGAFFDGKSFDADSGKPPREFVIVKTTNYVSITQWDEDSNAWQETLYGSGFRPNYIKRGEVFITID